MRLGHFRAFIYTDTEAYHRSCSKKTTPDSDNEQPELFFRFILDIQLDETIHALEQRVADHIKNLFLRHTSVVLTHIPKELHILAFQTATGYNLPANVLIEEYLTAINASPELHFIAQCLATDKKEPVIQQPVPIILPPTPTPEDNRPKRRRHSSHSSNNDSRKRRTRESAPKPVSAVFDKDLLQSPAGKHFITPQPEMPSKSYQENEISVKAPTDSAEEKVLEPVQTQHENDQPTPTSVEEATADALELTFQQFSTTLSSPDKKTRPEVQAPAIPIQSMNHVSLLNTAPKAKKPIVYVVPNFLKTPATMPVQKEIVVEVESSSSASSSCDNDSKSKRETIFAAKNPQESSSSSASSSDSDVNEALFQKPQVDEVLDDKPMELFGGMQSSLTIPPLGSLSFSHSRALDIPLTQKTGNMSESSTLSALSDSASSSDSISSSNSDSNTKKKQSSKSGKKKKSGMWDLLQDTQQR